MYSPPPLPQPTFSNIPFELRYTMASNTYSDDLNNDLPIHVILDSINVKGIWDPEDITCHTYGYYRMSRNFQGYTSCPDEIRRSLNAYRMQDEAQIELIRFIVGPRYSIYREINAYNCDFLFKTEDGGKTFELLLQNCEYHEYEPYVFSLNVNHIETDYYMPCEDAMCSLKTYPDGNETWTIDYNRPVLNNIKYDSSTGIEHDWAVPIALM